MSGSLIRAMPPSRADVGGHPLERHDGDGAGVLGDLRLLGGDDVHDDAALELLGHAALDAVGAGGRGSRALPRDAASRIEWEIRRAPIVRRLSGRPRPAPVRTGDLLEPVVDVEVPRQRPAGVQPEQPGQPAAAQRTGVADGVVVEAAGQARPGSSVPARSVRSAVGTPSRSAGRSRSSRPSSVLGQLPVPVDGRPRVGRRTRRGSGGALRAQRRRVLAGQLLGETGATLQLGVQRRPGPGDPGLSRRSRARVQARPDQQEQDHAPAEQQPGLGRHGASG